jgi:raffinose/stachyose/melibiose transport system permease protein
MKFNFKKIALYLVTLIICIIYFVPFYILLNVAFKPFTDTSSHWVPAKVIDWTNFTNVWNATNFGRILLNNVIITISVLIIVVIVGSLAAYPLARRKTKLNNIVYTVIVSCMIVPGLTILVPLYKVLVEISAVNTYWGIILINTAFGLPFAVFLYTGFINTVPKELDEAALLDGCSRFGIFFRIIIPLLKPVTATLIILNGVGLWNDYQFSLFFLQKPDMQTFTVALSQFFSQYNNNVHWVAAGCVIGMLPITALYLSLQKYFVKGVAAGAIKG